MTRHPNDRELRAALQDVFRGPVTRLRRNPFACSSSFTIEELEVTVGNKLRQVIFKNLSPDAILAEAAGVKPSFLYSPFREINIYQHIHPVLNMGTAQLYGVFADSSRHRYWLFLEKVDAPELYQCGDMEVWLEAARWLARFHASNASDADTARSMAPELLEHNFAYYENWLRRGSSFIGPAMKNIERSYRGAIARLLELPRTLIHGEFYASNILVREHGTESRICPIDWEMGAIGPGVLDVAALASGKWSRSDRLRMAEAWHGALPQRLRPPDLVAAFDWAQLQIAVQWLGWSDEWARPEQHAHDWLAEAVRASSQEIVRGLQSESHHIAGCST